jgi:translation initiation factor IF-3
MPPRLPSQFYRTISHGLRPSLASARPLVPAFTRAYRAPIPKHTPTPTPHRVENEAIPSDIVNYVDADGVFHADASVRGILRELDREKYTLVCVNPTAVDVPFVCKVLDREVVVKHDLERYQNAKENRKAKKGSKPQNVMKEIELSWAISDHDLEHRLKKVREFLEKGYRLDITIGTKKGMKKKLRADMIALLDRIEEACLQWGKERSEPEGEVGRRYTMKFEGKRVQKTEEPNKTEGREEDIEQPEGEAEGEAEGARERAAAE